MFFVQPRKITWQIVRETSELNYNDLSVNTRGRSYQIVEVRNYRFRGLK